MSDPEALFLLNAAQSLETSIAPQDHGIDSPDHHHDSLAREKTREHKGHTSFLRRHGYNRTFPARSKPYCSMCSKSFDTSKEGLLQHVREHTTWFQGRRHRYHACQVDFTHAADLLKHQRAVLSESTCGFHFPHTSGKCQGHHPPANNTRSGQLTNHDRLGFTVCLWNWEQAQLKAFMYDLDRLAQTC